MKDAQDIVVCVVDFNMFMPVAQKLAQQVKKVYYSTPTESGFQKIGDFVYGDGIKNIHRLNDYEDPVVFDEIDLFVFPYILYGGKQLLYERMGKAVWGARHADTLEMFKGKFYSMLDEIELPKPDVEVIIGMEKLRQYLKYNDDVYVKISRFRDTMDTWHHVNYAQSRSYLDLLTCELGPFQDTMTFYVIKKIDTKIEGGIDTYCVDGEWPDYGVLGYEKKNECYLATVKPMSEMPEEFLVVNQRMSPVLARYNYRQFFSTEVRVKDGKSYFIDPTCRTASPAGEEMLDLFGNLAEIMWRGAHGELVEPEITAQFAGEAYLRWIGDKREWKCLKVPNGLPAEVKLYGCAEVDGRYYWPPEESAEVIGCIVATDDDPANVISAIKETSEALKDAPVLADYEGFTDLLEQIELAGKQGIEFTDKPMPEPVEVLE